MNGVAALKEAGISLHVAATGAGAGIQAKLWSVPGASSFLSGCSFPYAQDETTELLGFTPEHSCCEETAIDLASAAYMKAYRFGGKAPVGLGVTAAVQTDRVRKGKDRIHICVMTDMAVRLETVNIPDGTSREKAGMTCDTTSVWMLLATLGIDIYTAGKDATELALSRFLDHPVFYRTGERLAKFSDRHIALMPGAFNPPHVGHFGIAAETEQEHQRRVFFHVGMNTPHKDALTVQDMLRRAKLLRGYDAVFTQGDMLYIEKARRFPEIPLVMGSDALLRMLDPNWGPEVKAMLFEFSQLGTTFYVATRDGLKLDDCFERAGLDPEFRFLFTELRGTYDISSTKLRES